MMMLPQIHPVDGSTQYITLKLDASMTMDPAKRERIVLSFINTTFAESVGQVYMKVVAFSGSKSELVLTRACLEGFCDSVSPLQAAVTDLQASLDAWPQFDPGSTAAFTAIQTAVADLGVGSQAHADVRVPIVPRWAQ